MNEAELRFQTYADCCSAETRSSRWGTCHFIKTQTNLKLDFKGQYVYKMYVNDYLGFRSREPLAFTLTVVKGASPSVMLENQVSPDL